MDSSSAHISVCVCTYQRLELLKLLLTELCQQETKALFKYSIVVVDNDAKRSAEETVETLSRTTSVAITYCVEPNQGIALARNRAIAAGEGDYVAFIDDDECPMRSWLLTLFESLHMNQVDGVLGPVKPQYEVEPPHWVKEAKFYDRPTYPTGYVIDWRKGRTGNVLLRRAVFAGGERFRPEFRTGEDQDFFRRVIDKGFVFTWCNEAIAYEAVPATRWDLRFLLRRALLRGATSKLHGTFGAREVAKSLIAVPAYSLALPLILPISRGRFMSTLVSLFDHVGRLLSLCGINPVKEAYITE
jgi:succinoglycan biosynthesis protein ExoM